ncbi:MAG: response regulator transcription factor [Saprospiraceae bacterium]|nr:response regulator transcription factor [Saprospiraceae bacterium]
MNITCIIVDDEKLARDLLVEYLNPYDNIEVIATCKNGTEAVQEIEDKKPELLFLDVHMPGINGFEVLENVTHHPRVIFTTAYDKYAVKAFEQNAVDYLLKPIEEERFQQAMKKVMEAVGQPAPDLTALLKDFAEKSPKKHSESLFVQKTDKFYRISAAEVLYLEASGDYTIISTSQEQYVSSNGISKLEEKLDPEFFIRIHRSTIINQNHLREIEKHFNGGLIVKMDNGKSFPVSRSYVKKIREKIL